MLAAGEVTFEILACSEAEDAGRPEREEFQEGLGVTG